jgi:hypothetical protein
VEEPDVPQAVAVAEQDARLVAVVEQGAPRAAAAAVQDVLLVAAVVRGARQAVAPAQPSEARAVRLSAEPSARSDRPAPVLRPARRRMTTSRHAQATARVEPRRLQSSSAE